MKKLFLFSSMLSGLYVHAQQPHEQVPFPTGNAAWTVFFQGTCVPGETGIPVIFHYTIEGDTTMYDTLYHRLVVRTGNDPAVIPETLGGIREDNQKIYFRKNLASDHFFGRSLVTENEILLYDFSLSAGDPVTLQPGQSPALVVEEVDYITIGDASRKRLRVGTYHNEPEYWVEGIGSMRSGLLGNLATVPTCGYWFWENVCFRENGQTAYLNSGYQNCEGDKLLSVNATEAGANINIYPNPALQYIHISNVNSADGLRAKLIDYTGRVLTVQDMERADNVITIPPQVSFCILLLNDKQGRNIRQQKIVVR